MEVITTALDGVLILEPRIFRDSRGYFFESFSQREFDSKVVPLLGHSVRFGMIEAVALVLEYCGGAQYCEAMGKAPWNEKLAAILRCQFHHHMLPECAAPVTDVHCHIKYCALHHPHKLALRIRHALVVQATHHPI